jgi:hypothetical protein
MEDERILTTVLQNVICTAESQETFNEYRDSNKLYGTIPGIHNRDNDDK